MQLLCTISNVFTYLMQQHKSFSSIDIVLQNYYVTHIATMETNCQYPVWSKLHIWDLATNLKIDVVSKDISRAYPRGIPLHALTYITSGRWIANMQIFASYWSINCFPAICFVFCQPVDLTAGCVPAGN